MQKENRGRLRRLDTKKEAQRPKRAHQRSCKGYASTKKNVPKLGRIWVSSIGKRGLESLKIKKAKEMGGGRARSLKKIVQGKKTGRGGNGSGAMPENSLR